MDVVARTDPYRRVSIALDFSGRDAEVLAETLRFLGDQRPELELIHVVESAGAKFLGKDSADAETVADAERLEALAAKLREMGFEAQARLGVGKRLRTLASLVNAFEPDLVVLGAHGHRFLLDLFLGSTADALRHRVKANVLVVGKGKK